MYTAGDHAFSVLQAIDQLGAGLGASSSKALPSSEGGGEDGNNPTKARASPSVGNAPLRLWAGERFLGEFVNV